MPGTADAPGRDGQWRETAQWFDGRDGSNSQNGAIFPPTRWGRCPPRLINWPELDVCPVMIGGSDSGLAQTGGICFPAAGS